MLKETLPTLPKEIQLEPTIKCNLDCIMCDTVARSRKAEDTSLASFKTTIDQFKSLKKIHLHGIGESLLNADFPEMIKYLKSLGVYVCFNDNFTIFDKATSELLVNLQVDEIRISLDAAKTQTYKKIRGRDLLPKVIENISTLIEVKKQRSSLKPRLKIVIVGQKDNLEELADIVALAKKIGLNEIVVQNMQSWSKPGNNPQENLSLLSMNKQIVKQYFKKAVEQAKLSGIKLILPPLEDTELTCTWPWTSCFITTDGFITPCCNCPDPRLFNFGNLLDQKFEAIWHSKKYINFRKSLNSDTKPEICKDCIILKGKLKDYRIL